MGVVSIPDLLANVQSFEDLRRFISIAFQNISKEINGGLDFTTNVSTAGPFPLTFASSGVNMKIVHNLNRVPTGFILVDNNADVRVWRAPSLAWDKSTAYLTASGAAQVQVLIF